MLFLLFVAAGARLAVLPPTGTQASKVAEQLILNGLGEMKRYEVIGSSDIGAILGFEKMKDALGCTDVACAAEIGGALGADKLLSVRMDALGPELIVSMTLIDAKRSAVDARAQANVLNEERRYPRAIEDALYGLFGRPPPTGSLEVTSVPAGAEAFVDDAPVGQTPVYVARIRPGTHRLRIAQQQSEVEVKAGTPRAIHLVLQSVESEVRTKIANENKRSGRIFITLGLGLGAALFAGISLPLFLSAGSLETVRQQQYWEYLQAATADAAETEYRDVERAVSRYNSLRGVGIGMLCVGGAFALSALIVGLTIPSVSVMPTAGGAAFSYGSTF